MKYLALFLVAVFAATASSKMIQIKPNKDLAQIDPKVVDFFTDFYNQLIAEPINTFGFDDCSLICRNCYRGNKWNWKKRTKRFLG
ncbi:hypothetical protein BpHYR1_038539 [Brachionus plicatilis]|uniref:Uncharacterized protein n=1 Tax=Brachionus plicatilis TaxID=10195 RepID=A0A3M7SPB8_BRAPC|nr:hypothetical protein BpHYR1_038539 [Brachionus plicatilis]